MIRAFLARLGLVENMARQALSRSGSGDTLATKLEYTFVFRPGAVGPLAPNVFTTQATLRTAVLAVQGPKLVEIDTSLAPAVFSGVVDFLDDVTLAGKNYTALTQPVLSFAAGATITSTNLLRVIGGLGLSNTGTVVWTIPAGAFVPVLYLEENSFLLAGAAAPFIHIPAGSTMSINADDADIGDTVNAAIQVDAGATLDANALAGGGFGAHAVAGAGTFNLGLIVGGFFEQPQGLPPTITYLDPPATINDTNALGIGPTAPLVFTSAATITRKTSGLVRVTACMSVTGAGAGAAVTFEVLRNPGGVSIASQTVDGGATHTPCTIPVIDTLPDQAAHTYAIRATQAATALSAAAGQARVTADELT